MRVATRLMGTFGALALLTLMLHVVLDVSVRYVLGESLRGTIEWVANWWMIGIVAMGLTVAEEKREHLEVTLISDRLSPEVRRWLDIFVGMVFIALLVPLAIYTFTDSITRMQLGSSGPAAGTPIWPFRYLLPLAFAFLCAQIIIRLVVLIRDPSESAASIEDESQEELL